MASDREHSEPPKAADTESFVRWLETVPDPVARYSMATEALEEHQRAVERLSSLRAEAVADAAEEKDSLAAVARILGVSRQRAHQLVQEAKSREARSPGRKARPARRKGSTP